MSVIYLGEAPRLKLKMVRDGETRIQDVAQVAAPSVAANLLSELIGDEVVEHLVAILLDTKNRVIGTVVISIGGSNFAVINMADLFRPAIVGGAVSIILGHNHPSGDPTPSPEDVRVTENAVKAGKILDLRVLDHIIVGERGMYRSLKESGLLKD